MPVSVVINIECGETLCCDCHGVRRVEGTVICDLYHVILEMRKSIRGEVPKRHNKCIES